MTSFANIPPPKPVIRRAGVLNGASWFVLLIGTVWNLLWFFIGTALHFSKWTMDIRNLQVIILAVSTTMVLLGLVAATIAIDVLFHRRPKIEVIVLWLWMTPMCLGIGVIYTGWPNRFTLCLDIAGGCILALIVRLNSPLLRSSELKSTRSIPSDLVPN